MSVHPTVRPPAPTQIMGSEAFYSCIWFFSHRLCHVVKFTIFQWLSFEWIFVQNCRFLKIDIRLQKDFATVVSKFAPECGVKQGAKLNIDYFVLHQRNFVIILTALFIFLLMLKLSISRFRDWLGQRLSSNGIKSWSKTKTIHHWISFFSAGSVCKDL